MRAWRVQTTKSENGDSFKISTFQGSQRSLRRLLLVEMGEPVLFQVCRQALLFSMSSSYSDSWKLEAEDPQICQAIQNSSCFSKVGSGTALGHS
jgi:hypothetical protein